MPSINFEVIWPDGDKVSYYSPSTIVREHLRVGAEYSQAEFDRRIHSALNAASERVYQRFGYYCSAASAELEKINFKLQFLREQEIIGEVRVVQLG